MHRTSGFPPAASNSSAATAGEGSESIGLRHDRVGQEGSHGAEGDLGGGRRGGHPESGKPVGPGLFRGLDRQPRLAHARWTGQHDAAGGLPHERVDDELELVITTDERPNGSHVVTIDGCPQADQRFRASPSFRVGRGRDQGLARVSACVVAAAR